MGARPILAVNGEGDDDEAQVPDGRGGREQLKAACGPFVEGVARVWGVIVYTDEDPGAPQKLVRFSTFVNLLEPYPEAPLPPSYQYDVQLETDRRDYAVSVSISHVLKPGEADRFTLRIGAKKASFHKFTLKLMYGDGEAVRSPPIHLTMFLTRADISLLHCKGEDEPTPGIWPGPAGGHRGSLRSPDAV